MSYSTEKYKIFCNAHFHKINMSYDCVCANRCSEITEFINSLLQELKEMRELPWSDEVNDAFKSNINSCEETLSKISNSIDSDFTNSEIIYEETQKLFDDLKNEITLFDNEISNEPVKDDYAQKWYKNLEFIKWIFPNYERDYKEWCSNCDKHRNKCDTLYEQISLNLDKLQEINTNILIVPKVKLTDIPGLTVKLSLSENYHYCMTDAEYRNMTLYDPNNRGGNFGKGGCSMTAAATALSIATGTVIDPREMNEFAKENRVVGRNHRTEMISQLAELKDLNYNIIYKDETKRLMEMIERLENKESTAVILLKPDSNKNHVYYTGNGHYLNMVDAKTENGQVLVKIWETAYENRRDEREGWHTLDEIVKALNKINSIIEISPNEIENAYRKYD